MDWVAAMDRTPGERGRFNSGMTDSPRSRWASPTAGDEFSNDRVQLGPEGGGGMSGIAPRLLQSAGPPKILRDREAGPFESAPPAIDHAPRADEL